MTDQCTESHKEYFIIIVLSQDSSPKIVFTWHSGFPDPNLPRVYLQNLSEMPSRGKKSGRNDRFMGHVVFTGLQQCLAESCFAHSQI